MASMAEAEDLEVPSDLNGEHLSNGENREVNVKELQFLRKWQLFESWLNFHCCT